MSGRDIPDAVIEPQVAASDPSVSAWVSANAGSGKTYVLAQRVIRLLLEGTAPSKILCLTYTKAAAANMANRVFERLARWATLDDESLDKEIRLTGLKQVDGKRRARARKLFAEALETPGGLKVQTIHAFCTRLLQQFPFEADVAARFKVLEETQHKQMLEDIRMSVLLAASAQPDSAGGRALAAVIPLVSDFAFQAGLAECIRQHRKVMAWLERLGGIDGAMTELSRMLGIDPKDTVESVERELLDASHVPISEWPAVMATLAQGTKSDRDQAARLKAAHAAADAGRLTALISVFCTDSGSPRKDVVTKGIRDKYPDLCKRLADEQRRFCALLERRQTIIIRTRTGALLTLASEIITRYRAEKEARGLLDYDDLIARTRDLLTRVGAAWVHYKLDLGIDHLLIDEAQDTSPEQWDIIRQLVSEFAAGAGARGLLRRSIFAVGDDKQSIFSFQGADPSEFDAMRLGFKKTFEAAAFEWRDVRLAYSFRSNDSVLSAVQQVFEQQAVYRSVTADADGISAHLSLPDAAPGFVEIWPIVKPDEKPEVVPWDSPFDKTSETSPRVKLARQIAKTVRAWIDRKERVGTDRHAVRPGDILVLVRQRGPLFEAIIRALKNENIDVAGADRLILTEHIAVMDLLALADALLLPEDDLALASVLKSPLIGLTEEELFAVAWNRTGSLRAALSERRPELASRLDEMARAAQRQSPFGFYALLLGAGHGRKRLVSRLGLEANDVLDEFLNLALAYESRETPSLQGFVAWLRTASAEIKRDMEIVRDEVRVMTVHGAKGLEAPIVILADTTTEPQGPTQHQPRLLPMPAQQAAPGTPDRLAWMPSKKDDTAVTAAARATVVSGAVDEYRRLLYVALTRAADRLIICGSVGVRSRPQGCWYDLICDALGPDCKEEPADIGDGSVLRFRKGPERPETALPVSGGTATATCKVPDWLSRDARREAPAPQPLSPSQAYDETAPLPRSDGATRKAARERGVAMHRLLQSLPGLAPERRVEAARRFFERRRRDFTAEDGDALAREALVLIEDGRFHELFATGSRGEVPIIGRVVHHDGERPVAGIVDRLAVTADAILIADYKTNRDPPRTLAETPPAYIAQLALYRAVLAQLYPGKPVRAALVWTEVPELMEVPAEAMDKALSLLPAPGPP